MGTFIRKKKTPKREKKKRKRKGKRERERRGMLFDITIQPGIQMSILRAEARSPNNRERASSGGESKCEHRTESRKATEEKRGRMGKTDRGKYLDHIIIAGRISLMNVEVAGCHDDDEWDGAVAD